MRILIALHHVIIGGDTINALELAGRLRDRGHAVTLFAFTHPDGLEDDAPLLGLAAERGVEVRTFRRASGVRGRLRVIRELASYVKEERFDVVHAFGHQDTYYAFVAAYGIAGVQLVVNDYNMAVTRALPRRVPLIAGTREVVDQARRVRRAQTHLVEPPVDVDLNAPSAVDPDLLRHAYGIERSEVLLVMVSRLVRNMKSEGLRGAMDAMRLLDDPSLRLMLVGDGEARLELAERADKVNAELGREAVILTGSMADPRAAYAAADIVLGMGHSGLRGMAFAKPVVIVGERGFCLPVTPDTFAHVDYVGVYGVGDGTDVALRLATHLRPLIQDGEVRRALGTFGRRVAYERYSLDAAADRLESIYRQTTQPRSWIAWALDAAHIARCYAPAKAHRLARLLIRR